MTLRTSVEVSFSLRIDFYQLKLCFKMWFKTSTFVVSIIYFTLILSHCQFVKSEAIRSKGGRGKLNNYCKHFNKIIKIEFLI